MLIASEHVSSLIGLIPMWPAVKFPANVWWWGYVGLKGTDKHICTIEGFAEIVPRIRKAFTTRMY